MKKLVYWVGGETILLIVLGFLGRGYLGMIAMTHFMEPDQTYSQDRVPNAPDYAEEANWAALPHREDMADVTPSSEISDNQDVARVDVFFVHPTTYVSSEGWNQPMGHQGADKRTDEWVMRDQASVFNGCCKIYAPRYRQATLFSFQDQSGSGEQSLDLAYTDVKRAFYFFIENYNLGRPFIVASHSQGSLHLDRLLKEEVATSELFSRMIVAYPVGFSVDGSNGVPICGGADQINCQVSWNANTTDAVVKLAKAGDVCVNPISWRADSKSALASDNLGSVTFSSEGGIDLGVADAKCSEGSLIVSEVVSERYDSIPFGPGNYHMYDYSFFYMNIRENLEERLATYWLANVSD